MGSRQFGLCSLDCYLPGGEGPKGFVKTELGTLVSLRKLMGVPLTLAVILDSWGQSCPFSAS